MLVVPNLRVVEPNNIFRKVPTRKPNAAMRKSVSLIRRETVEQPHAAGALKPILATVARGM